MTEPTVPAPLQVTAALANVHKHLAEVLGDRLAELEPAGRQQVFDYARDLVEAELAEPPVPFATHKALDLMGCLAEAITLVHPGYSSELYRTGEEVAVVTIDPTSLPGV